MVDVVMGQETTERVRLVHDKCAVVLAGSWNRAIFTPEWAQENLFAKDEMRSVEIAFPTMAIKLGSLLCHVVVHPARVDLVPTSDSEESFAAVHRIAAKLLAKLPETPIQAVGINFAFALEHRSPALDAYAKAIAAPEAAEQTEVKFSVRSGPDAQVNLQLTLFGDSAMVDINNHWQVRRADDAKQHLDPVKAMALLALAKTQARQLLHEEAP